ncbi:MAG TPA: hypothetical protein VFJ96_04665 [Gemmatimonadaceae bacterium]|nr:hypothetical protein [Gemmatimonadaceae bacterium]
MRLAKAVAAIIVAAGVSIPSASAHAQHPFDQQLLSAFTYRNIAPFRMQARIADIDVPAFPEKAHLYTMYVAPWIGGVFKTTNNGTTWESLFDDQPSLSIGDVTLAPSNPNIVWVGTGDAFTSRSSYAGDGVYKSTDGGKTWTHMGLDDTQHIARIVIDPTNPDIVYVAAMGHLYSTNAERGVFKTTDGGKTWQKVLYINDNIGVIDLVMNPQHANVLYAATYDKTRLPWQMINGGPESGIYKTTDAGAHWTRLAGGFPSGKIGRIGLDIYRKNPEILYAIVENENLRPGATAPTGPSAGGPGQRFPTIGGEVYRTDNGGATWTKMNPDSVNVSPKGPYYFNQIRVDPNNDKVLFLTGYPGGLSHDGGKSFDGRVFPNFFGDFRTFWFDPENSDRMILGSDGGIAVSYDGGKSSDAYSNLPLGSVYSLGADNEDPYNVYAGLQDHENWRGPSNSASGRITEQDWYAVGDGDGIVTLPDPTDSRWLYTTREYGAPERVDQKLGYRTNITPQRDSTKPPYRFLWETPLAISPHDSKVIYLGTQVLLRSTDRGDHWTEISPDLSTHPADKILPESEGGIPGGIPWFAISTIAESPLTAGVIWVGTSDGRVWLTRNTGKSWTDMTAKLTTLGAREDAYVSRVFPSSHVPGRAYVAKRGYKFDDFRPFLYRTDDYGATWHSIVGDLPNEPINVIVEDRKNPDLLFVGNDAGVYVTIDGGTHWVNMNNNMPRIPVHDLLVHPRANDLILGTYGRGIYITNIEPLQEMTPAMLAEDVHLFAIAPTVQRVTYQFGANDYLFGQRQLQTPNEPDGMVIRCYLARQGTGDVTITIANAEGQTVATIAGPTAPGMNCIVWSTRLEERRRRGPSREPRPGECTYGRPVRSTVGARAASARGDGAPRPPGRASRTVLDPLAPLGDYTVTLQADGKTLTQKARITATQGWRIGPVPEVIR